MPDHDTDAAFPLPKALLIALFLESVLFGIFAVLYGISFWILRSRRQHPRSSKIDKWLLGTGTVMFILTVIHMAIDVQRAIDGFIEHGGTPGGTTTFFKRLNDPLFIAKLAIYNTQTLVGDAFVIYRLYVVYNRKWWIAVLPLSLLAGTAVVAYGIPVTVARVGGSDNIFSPQITPWITSFFALTLATNVLATILLSGRIMWSNYKVRLYHSGVRFNVLETIIQSAALYSAALISLLATYVSRSNAQYVCLDTLQPIIGITFTLIIIRVGLGERAGEQSKRHTAPVNVAGSPTPFASPLDHERPFSLRPLAVKVSVSKKYDRASFDVYEQMRAANGVERGPDVESGVRTMWLLSTDRVELHSFARNYDAVGGYVILSHTWDGNEQTFQEVRTIAERCRASGTNPRDDPALSPKIRNLCILAEKHGYRWVWDDSCCIDKTSSSELSEAVNSMYRWYNYAYLADVPSDDDLHAKDSAFRKSRWHTRGWTLQELIAPDFLIFLSADWCQLGNRADLAVLLWDITLVPVEVFTGVTTRVEDEAYSLMGIFGVNMPTNYGEGRKAFIRLQYEIMQHGCDMSLFAFGYRVKQDNYDLLFRPQDRVSHHRKYLMANSPHDLDSGVDYVPALRVRAEDKSQYPPPPDSMVTGPFDGVELPSATVTNYGIQFRLPIYEADGITIAVILCRGNGRHIGMFLTRDSEGKDPTRPRYFTGCAYSEPSTGPATYVARLADLGDDLYGLTFNGKPVNASWRTIYVVPAPSALDYEDRTIPSLILNCNPVSRFRIPRWLIARLTDLQFEFDQIRNSKDLQVVTILHRHKGDNYIFVSLGSCTKHCGSDSRPSPRLWAKVDVAFLATVDTFDHDCSEDHLDSESWTTRSKVFGDADRRVRLSFVPSTRMLATVLEVHLELLGSVFEEMLRDPAVSFPSLEDLERAIPHPTPLSDDLVPSFPRRSPSQTQLSLAKP
ncbi:hypothetical protein GSI_12071 [Ganoderma sinense ZZ0214-1]|uniref:Heterokaryon incompatibility domain-containing protein n=1 Tax=Ganoderma sinense ZZ0214-1 TaxID=1077348 RepID=A0A2G8RXS6_9APHY|nr:hypothetical protein GSI_12071 [Ganoderma sinense ZZ0214-1]